MSHATKRVTLDGRSWANVDVELAATISHCWRLRIFTLSCCQGDQSAFKYAYIQFEQSFDAEQFLRAMLSPQEAEFARDSLLSNWGTPPTTFEGRILSGGRSPLDWRWRTTPRLHGPSGCLEVSIDFPPQDITEIEKRLGYLPDGWATQ